MCSFAEAQAVGLPVIASDVGGVKEVMVHGGSGFLVPAGDVDAWADKLTYVISTIPESGRLWPGQGENMSRKITT